MFRKHWNRKTGRGRFNINRSKSSAKAIVKKAGPMDRRLFTETPRTATVFGPTAWIPSGAGASEGQGHVPIFQGVDFDQQNLALKERVQVSLCQFDPLFRVQPNAATNHVSVRHIYWWIFKANNQLAADQLTGLLNPWTLAQLVPFAQQDMFVMKRGHFDLWQTFHGELALGISPTSAMNTSVLSDGRYKKDLRIRFKRKYWLDEGEGIWFAYKWWTTLKNGTSAGLPSVDGSFDTLVRYARM